MQGIEFSQIATIAQKEFWDRIRNRWVLAVAVIFLSSLEDVFPGYMEI